MHYRLYLSQKNILTKVYAVRKNKDNEKLYLSPIVDLFNGEVISFNLSRHPVFAQVVDMLEKAFSKIPDNTK